MREFSQRGSRVRRRTARRLRLKNLCRMSLRLRFTEKLSPLRPAALRSGELTQRDESMTTIKAIRLASVVTAINVLVASGFSIAAIIRPQYLVPAESVP